MKYPDFGKAVWLKMVGLLCLLAITSHASSLVCLEVAQPILTEEAIVISRVSYLVYRGPVVRGDEVTFTTEPNSITVEGSDNADNLNAASLLGLKLKTTWAASNPQDPDTLLVVLDCLQIKPSALRKDLLPLAVKATLECILTNAAASQPPVGYVHIDVNSATFEGLGGTFALDKIGKLPRRRVFQ